MHILLIHFFRIFVDYELSYLIGLGVHESHAVPLILHSGKSGFGYIRSPHKIYVHDELLLIQF